ncbi:MAG: hypothetical protein K0S33_1756 [Bacteroidetes bacterium]|jgi:hypothetical protein|nr:hypothetical protein [Bacteroidota bacterium]
MYKKAIIILLCLKFVLLNPLWIVAQGVKPPVVMVTDSIKFPKPPKFPELHVKEKKQKMLKDFLEMLKERKQKLPQKPKDEIAALKTYIDSLKLFVESYKLYADTLKIIIGQLNGRIQELTPEEPIEWSLHHIEQSNYLSSYDSKNTYRSEIQWAYDQGFTPEGKTPKIRRKEGGKTVYGFHPFWLGNYYYDYNFELYDRVAYFGYSVDPATGGSSTKFPAHSFCTSRIVRKAAERSGNHCKVDLCITNYGLANNRAFFSGDWQGKINKLVGEVKTLLDTNGAGGICIDFQQVFTQDSTKYLYMVKQFYESFQQQPGRYQITVVLPSYSHYFPYTVSGKGFAELWKYTDRFIVMGYSSYSALYEPPKDTLAKKISHDIMWNILLVDDGMNHYAALAPEVGNALAPPEKGLADKFLLSIPASEIKMLKNDTTARVYKYADLKLLKQDEGFLPAFQEKLAYADLKGLKGVAIWGMGNDNGEGDKDLQQLVANYTNNDLKEDESLLNVMEMLIAENKTLTISMDEFFPFASDSLADTETPVPLPEVLRVDLPAANGVSYKTQWEKEMLIIQHVVVLCLVILLFFALAGVVISFFFESVRESVLTKENVIFVGTLFMMLGLALLLKRLDIISNTILLFSIGILIGTIVPFVIHKKQRNKKQEDKP